MSSGRKRKAADVSTTLRVIRDLLLELKPLLHGPSLPVARPTDAPAPGSASATTLAHLHTLTNTALELSTVLAVGRETLQPGEQDELDAEGVALWNRGAELRERGLMELYARARAAAYAVIECGCERTLGTEDLIRLLELGAKAASALSSVGDGREAEALLVKAASIEEALSKLPVSNSITEQTQRVRAQTTYFRVRAENMFLRKTMDPALFMMRQACDDIRLSLLAPSDLLPLMTLALDVGHSLLALLAEPKGNSQEVEHAKRAALAIDWLTIGLRLGERSERGATQQSHPASRIVKKNITLALARAFVAAASFDDAYLERAEATLEEIVAIGSPEYEPGDLNRARWLWLQCALQRRSDDLLIRAFNSVIDGDEMTESNIHRIVKTAIHGKAALSRPATTKVLQHLIQRVASAAAGAEADKQHTELLVNAVLSILVHLKTEQDARVLCRELNIAFDIVSTKVAQLSPSSCKACQMVVWQLGDARFGSTPPQYDEALLFYELSLHAALQPSQADSHLVHRKMALCCILSQKYERAAECIARCDPAEASTCYLKVFNAVQQGLEAPAVAAVRSLAICADVDAKLLLLTTQLATESNLTGVLAAALDALLKKMRSGSVDLSLASALVLARCTIRLDVRHLAKANNDRESDELAAGLIRHFSIALELISSESAKSGGGGRHEKECLWLYKQAYNSAIDGTRQAWPESVVYGLFELALSFMGSFEEIALSTPDEMRTHRALAAYASCVARYVDLAAQSDDDERSRLGNALLRRCEVFFAILEPLVKDESLGSSGAIFLEMSRTVHALQVSCLLNIRAWGAIEDAIKEATELGRVCDEQLFEVFAHLVFSHPACPAEVATNTLDTLLNAALDLDLVPSLERLARWIRASVSLLLASGGPSAATKALEHVNEAIDVMRAHVSPEARSWPQDEADWLIAICATEGQKDSATANEARAKQWLEAAVALLPFASWGDAKAQKLRQRYSAVLAASRPAPRDDAKEGADERLRYGRDLTFSLLSRCSGL